MTEHTMDHRYNMMWCPVEALKLVKSNAQTTAFCLVNS